MSLKHSSSKTFDKKTFVKLGILKHLRKTDVIRFQKNDRHQLLSKSLQKVKLFLRKRLFCYLMQLNFFQSHEDFTRRLVCVGGGGSPSRGLPEGLPFCHCHSSRWLGSFFHAFVLPHTQLWLYCHWNSAYLGFHSNSALPRPSSVSTWCLPLSWSIASVSLKDPLRKSLSGLSY